MGASTGVLHKGHPAWDAEIHWANDEHKTHDQQNRSENRQMPIMGVQSEQQKPTGANGQQTASQ
jgi:hypothetical protein